MNKPVLSIEPALSVLPPGEATDHVTVLSVTAGPETVAENCFVVPIMSTGAGFGVTATPLTAGGGGGGVLLPPPPPPPPHAVTRAQPDAARSVTSLPKVLIALPLARRSMFFAGGTPSVRTHSAIFFEIATILHAQLRPVPAKSGKVERVLEN